MIKCRLKLSNYYAGLVTFLKPQIAKKPFCFSIQHLEYNAEINLKNKNNKVEV